MITAVLTWAVLGLLFFAFVTVLSGGRVEPTRAAVLAILCGPAVWVACVLLAFGYGLLSLKSSAPVSAGRAEAQRDAALQMLEAILDDHRAPAGDTCLADGMEAEIDALLQATGRRPRTPATR